AVQDLMAGALDVAARAQAIAHIDGCPDCRDLISLLARDATRDAAVDTLRETSERPPAGPNGGRDGREAALVDTQESVPPAPKVNPAALLATADADAVVVKRVR